MGWGRGGDGRGGERRRGDGKEGEGEAGRRREGKSIWRSAPHSKTLDPPLDYIISTWIFKWTCFSYRCRIIYQAYSNKHVLATAVGFIHKYSNEQTNQDMCCFCFHCTILPSYVLTLEFSVSFTYFKLRTSLFCSNFLGRSTISLFHMQCINIFGTFTLLTV